MFLFIFLNYIDIKSQNRKQALNRGQSHGNLSQLAYLALCSALSPHVDGPVTNTGPHGSLPSPLGLCLSSSLSSVVAFWDSGSLVLSRLCPNSIWGPSPPSSPAIHTSLLSFFIPSSLADRLLSHVAWSLLVRVSPRLILGICWLSSLFVLRGFSLPLPGPAATLLVLLPLLKALCGTLTFISL